MLLRCTVAGAAAALHCCWCLLCVAAAVRMYACGHGNSSGARAAIERGNSHNLANSWRASGGARAARVRGNSSGARAAMERGNSHNLANSWRASSWLALHAGGVVSRFGLLAP